MRKLLALALFAVACQQVEASPMAGKLLDSLYLSGAGEAAASGTVSLYMPGTLVSVQAYSDDALTQLVAQPVALDAAGKSVYPLYVSAPVRAIIRAANGSTLYDITRIDGQRAEIVSLVNTSFPGSSTVDQALTAVAASLGGTNGQFLAPGAGAVARDLQDVIADLAFDVKNYGAVGSGVADDTTAAQNAIAAAQAAGGGVVYFPPGTYLISSPLSISGSGVDIVGAGTQASIIKQSNANQGALSFSTSTGSGVLTNRVATIQLTCSTTSVGTAITTSNLASISVSGVFINGGFRKGITSSGSSGPFMLSGSYVSVNPLDALSVGITATNGGYSFLSANIIIGAATTGVVLGNGTHALYGNFISATGLATAVGVLANTASTDLTMAGNMVVAGASGHAVSIGSSFTGTVNIATGQVFTPDISDARSATTAPVAYSFSADGNFTPLPLQADSIRVVATAAAVVTINAVAATGFGRRFSLICARTTASAVTWTFNAQYVLSAAVAPANGNRVNLLLEYNPLDNKVYEIGRAATAN